MENWLNFIKIIIKVIFIAIVPAFIIYKRVKQKVSTGFALGAILMSFIIAILGVSSVYEDPADTFLNEINAGNYEESKRLYKIIIQGGPETLAEVDENKIIYREHLARIKKELIAEYGEIAERIYGTVSLDENSGCADLVEENKKLGNLKNSQKLLEFSSSIGGGNPVLSEKLAEKIEKSELIISNIEDKCK